MKHEPKRDPQRVDLGRYIGLGMAWAASTFLFLYLGTWLDKWLGTEPALTLLGAFAGAAGGFYYMYRQLTPPKSKP